tara:strand:- start:3859 stop:5142 length:1284 start_codon:yes stop_codon:yes gene_type:complete
MHKYKFSLITPSHSPLYLEELYKSIVAQTYTNWEWVIFLNNGVTLADIPSNIKKDKRVTVSIKEEAELGDGVGILLGENVGYLKALAFTLGTGDILVEVDHDDMLTPDCLEELNIAFQDEEVGFVYSDNAKLKEDFIPYNTRNGWTHRKVNWEGQELVAMNAFKPSSQSLAFIWYCPDHVRAWRTSVYQDIGGHNSELSICDDHELLIRTYLNTKFYHIPKCLYIYRYLENGENTYLKRNAAIQTKTVELYHHYAYQLAERDCDLKGLMKVDLGGGIYGKPGYTTIDKEGGDIVWDLDKGIPLEDNSVGVINASHVVEHLKDPLATMKEIHRVLCHGGWAMIEVPSTDGRGAWMDPTHVSYWNENSFLYYTNKDQAQYIRNSDVRFQEFRCETHFPSDWYKSKNVPVVTAWLSCVKEEERLPHTLLI